MYTNRSKVIVRVASIVVMLGAIGFVINYFASTRSVAIDAKNTATFSIVEEGSDAIGKDTPASNSSVRVKNDKTYTVAYKGVAGYANGATTITPTTTTVTINPDYSDEKLSQMLDSEIVAINAAIVSSGTNITTLYTVDRGQLSHFGEWYFTTLTYTGSSDDESSDTLVVGLQKKSGKWVPVLPPDILFTTIAYPDVERSFINTANAYHDTRVSPTEE